MKISGFLFIVFLFPLFLCAQETTQNVLHLKNGNIVKGHIVEFIPDSIVKIQTVDSSLFVFRSTEIDKISIENITADPMQSAASPLKKKITETKIIHVCFYGGVALPLASFQAEDGGNAATGATFGLQLWTEKRIGFLLDANYTSNNVVGNSSGQWTSIFILAGPRIVLKNKINASISIAPLAGFLMSQLSADRTISANSLAYGIVMQFEISKQFVFGAQFMGGTPSYSTVIRYSADQTTSIVGATLGVKI
jgi:hypothetical protein